MRSILRLGFGALFTVVASTPAGAQVLVTPGLAGAFGADTVEPPRLVYDISGGYWGAEPIGLDVGIAYAPDFFPPAELGTEPRLAGNLTTIAFNVVLGPGAGPQPRPGVRPYFSAGPVLFRLRAQESTGFFCSEDSTIGFGIGGGVYAFFTESLGLRFDLRYFRDPRREVKSSTACSDATVDRFSDLGFSRGTFGFVWRL